MVEWTDMLISIGLSYPPKLKSGREAEKANRLGMFLTNTPPIERVQLADHGRELSYRKHLNGINTFGWQRRTYIIHGRRREVWAAMCW